MRVSRATQGIYLIWAAVIAAAIGIAAYATAFAVDPKGLDWFESEILYNGPIALAALACLIRAATSRHQRGAWIAFGLGLAAWAAGDVYWTEILDELKRIPYPSWADAGFLAAVPCLFVGIALIARERLGRGSRSIWFDGAITAVAASAAAVAVLGPALVGLTMGDTATVLTNLAYPVGDVLLIAFIVALLVVGGMRDARSLVLIGAGLLLWTAADAAYLWAEATGTWTDGWLDLLWPLGALLIAVSAAISPRAPIARRRQYRPGIGVPLFSTGLAVLVLVWDHYDRANAVAIWLAAATLLLVAIRLAISFRDNARLLAILHDDAVTDQLTGLGNRRALFNDLESLSVGPRVANAPDLFVIFDLDGFKAYNDNFGHPAGDVLLTRLGASLRAAAGTEGRAYRLGGDEFCVLIELGERKGASVVELLRAALSEHGEGFRIGASCGSVGLPHEASTPSEVLRLADKRLYAEKAERSSRSGELTRNLLMRIVREREPELGEHVESVAGLAREVGRRMGIGGEEMDVLVRAAELHDIGKIAIPDDVLHKPGPLTDAEWELMRRHTLIGERILGVTGALAPVGKVVRSSHERWDGDGYPDGLAGDGIPVAARVIFVCDAYEAMTSGRSYKPAIGVEDALVELRRNAGTQFDPTIVELLGETIAARAAAASSSPTMRTSR